MEIITWFGREMTWKDDSVIGKSQGTNVILVKSILLSVQIVQSFGGEREVFESQHILT